MNAPHLPETAVLSRKHTNADTKTNERARPHREPLQECEASAESVSYLVWPFFFLFFFTRRHRLTHHEWCSPEREKSMVMSHFYTASRARLCRERCRGVVGRSVGRTDGICIPAASSLTSGGSGRDVLENSAQRAAVFGRDGITHLCASAGRETLDLLDLQPVKSKAQSQRRPGGAKEQLVPPLLEKQPFRMFY